MFNFQIHEGKSYNEKADIWSLGCVLFEVATLKVPFTNIAAIIRADYNPGLFYKRVEPIPKVIPIVEMMLKMKPDGRPSAEKILKGNIH